MGDDRRLLPLFFASDSPVSITSSVLFRLIKCYTHLIPAGTLCRHQSRTQRREMGLLPRICRFSKKLAPLEFTLVVRRVVVIETAGSSSSSSSVQETMFS